MDNLFRSVFAGGFECSSHRRADGRRVDCLAATRHDLFAAQDYAALAAHGLLTARDGLRWHLIETSLGAYDWSSVAPIIAAARRHGVQVIWDVCHYGWPDDIDIWSSDFVERFGRFAAAAAVYVRAQSGEAPFFCMINELSYWAWAGGDQGLMNPLGRHQGDPLKRQLVRATIAGIEAVRRVEPQARILHAEPCIHIAARVGGDHEAAAASRNAQYQALDMLAGRIAPELGGSPDYLDVVGVNYYPDNQWFDDGCTIPLGSHAYRPLRLLLAEVYERYGRPMMIAETGAESTARAAWLHYVAAEVRAARAAGVPVGSICLYPILDYPGWVDDRVCEVGLFGFADDRGCRVPDRDLAEELRAQQARADWPSTEARARGSTAEAMA